MPHVTLSYARSNARHAIRACVRPFRKQPQISLLTDFGKDEAVYLVKSAIRYVNPRAKIEDITHTVPPCNVLVAAWRFARVISTSTEKEGTVYVAVVDPGVGTDRKAIIVRTRSGKYLVGPNNGVLSLAFEREGIQTAVAIENNALTLRCLAHSCTFDGKDVFAPAAAHVARGVPIEDFGPNVSSSSLVRINLPREQTPISRSGCIVDIDDFGTIRTNLPNHVPPSAIGEAARLQVSLAGNRRIGRTIMVRPNFGSAQEGEFFALLASTGCIDLPVNLGRADQKIGISFADVGLGSDLKPTANVSIDFTPS